MSIEELRAELAGARTAVRLRHVVAVLPPPRLDAQKKTAHAAEQDRADVLTRRQAWFDGQTDLDPERLVFIDETWASTNMARTHGRAPRGERLRMAVPHGHWKTTTLVAGARRRAASSRPGCSTGRSTATPSRPTSARSWPRTEARRHRHHGQPLQPQAAGGAGPDRGGRGAGALPPAVQPRLQPDREGLRQAQGPAAQGRPSEPSRACGAPSAASSISSRLQRL